MKLLRINPAMKHEDNPSDSELFQSMLAGDEEALAALYRRRQGGLYRFAVQMCGSQALAEDVTQEVFMVLIRDGQTFDPTRGSLNAFLVGVARNLLLRRLQRERFYVPMNQDSDDEATTHRSFLTAGGPMEDLSRIETVNSVRLAVLALPERYREEVVLCDLQEMSYVEAAEVLNCAVGTVRSRLHRARAFLIDKLRPTREEEATSTTAKSARCFA
ncbi:MAG: RNA polymerase sigma factor [Acidobacteriota bacterium]|nr:RNA polymerase sigma factor [Acidobacteriota bacterium]